MQKEKLIEVLNDLVESIDTDAAQSEVVLEAIGVLSKYHDKLCVLEGERNDLDFDDAEDTDDMPTSTRNHRQ